MIIFILFFRFSSLEDQNVDENQAEQTNSPITCSKNYFNVEERVPSRISFTSNSEKKLKNKKVVKN